jgi:hypothetical protein
MRKSSRLWLVVVLVVAVVAVVGVWFAREMKIDSCLDRGGRWNYSLGQCEGAKER